MDYWSVKVKLVKLVKRHTYYPVPGNAKVSMEPSRLYLVPRRLWS